MHDVGFDVREDPVRVLHEHRGVVGSPQLVHGLGDGFQRVDVESGIGLVEDRELGIEHRELQDLVALLLPTRETFVHGAGQVARVPADHFELLFEPIHELDRAELLCTTVLADRIHRGAQEVGVGDAADGHRVLEREEHTLAGPDLRRHGEQIDRKSTRLNSSHLVISYAVFCLKKKKTSKKHNHYLNSTLDICLKKTTAESESTRKILSMMRVGEQTEHRA